MRKLRHVLSNVGWGQESGLSLLEVILSVAIILVTLSSMIVLSNATLTSSGSSRNGAVADRYAREGIEILRDFRDNEGWAALRRIGNFTSDHPVWGGPYSGTVAPSCVVTNAQRYYFGFLLPATGVATPVQPNVRAVACGSHATFASGNGSYQSRWLHNFCQTSLWLTEPASSPIILGAQVQENFYRVVILGYETEDRVFVRSTVCYYEGNRINSVQVDGYLTNWQ